MLDDPVFVRRARRAILAALIVALIADSTGVDEAGGVFVGLVAGVALYACWPWMIGGPRV